MTRGRMIWLGLLAVGIVVAVALRPTRRAPDSETDPVANDEPSLAASSDPAAEVEIELDDPGESGIAAPEREKSAPTETSSEAELVQSLRTSWESDPARAISLATLGEARFGDSPGAVERRLYEIKALVKLGRVGSARTKAESYLALYPPGPMTDEVERLTGVHRRPEP